MKKRMVHQKTSELRRIAEERLKSDLSFDDMSTNDIQKLIHELRVHQIELEMQNEELQRTQAEAEELHKKYEHFYDFSPVGYFTLNEKGKIFEVNLTGANQLGMLIKYVPVFHMDKMVKRTTNQFNF